jgi:catechol 2,3-dioxygenase-like lactoylglutathione lyase family enzyme
MLGDKTAHATLAVKDLPAAKKFYEAVLGLKAVHTEGSEAVTYEAGESKVLVYRSQYAGTNQATAVTWLVGNDLEKVVEALRERGAKFERYDLPGMTREGDIHTGGGTKAAWCKDPDGNILALINM